MTVHIHIYEGESGPVQPKRPVQRRPAPTHAPVPPVPIPARPPAAGAGGEPNPLHETAAELAECLEALAKYTAGVPDNLGEGIALELIGNGVSLPGPKLRELSIKAMKECKKQAAGKPCEPCDKKKGPPPPIPEG